MRSAGLIALWLALAGLAAPPPGQVLMLTNEMSLDAAVLTPPPNVSVLVTLLRHRPVNHVSVAAEKVGGCQTLPELAQLLRVAGPLEVLCHARREVACGPAARAEFRTVETRAAYFVQDLGASPTNHSFGLDLHADVRVLSPATSTTPSWLALSWEGTWSGSSVLLAGWEKLAVRGFNLARAVPGITYTKAEPDEDGFVNTSGGTDLGGLFRRKKKDPKKTGPAPAAAPAGPAPTSEHEPSYSAIRAPEQVPLQGQWIGVAGQLLISRKALSVGADSGDLYLVVQSRMSE